MLLGLYAQEGCRGDPAARLVVGRGTSPIHSGLGFFNAEQHVIGWNRGRNPLPFVLADDVAAAILGALQTEQVVGRCYNLVGDVQPTAREYLAWLAEATSRPLRFHPKFPATLLAEEGAKWLLKQAGGRRSPPPSRRDLLSRGLRAPPFDCSDASATRLSAAGRSGPLPRGRVRDAVVMRAAAPLLLHVFATFATGGPQVRFATLANRLGGRFRHAVVAMDGRQEARALLDPALDIRFPQVGVLKGDTRGNLRRFRAALRDIAPDLLVTSNWGSIEWALARFGTGMPHLHMEDGFGPEERERQVPRRVLARRLLLRRATVVLPSRLLAYRHRDRHACNRACGCAERRRCALRRCGPRDGAHPWSSVPSRLRPEKKSRS